MSIGENNNKLRGIAGVLTLLLIVLTVYTVKLYNDNKDTITILENEKLNTELHLEELRIRAMANGNKEDLSKGLDTISVSDTSTLIATSQMTLK